MRSLSNLHDVFFCIYICISYYFYSFICLFVCFNRSVQNFNVGASTPSRPPSQDPETTHLQSSKSKSTEENFMAKLPKTPKAAVR